MDKPDHRNAEGNPEEQAAYVQHLIERLRRLEIDSRPSNGIASAKDKDAGAQDALRLAGRLVEALAGWALDHQVGLAFRSLENLPRKVERGGSAAASRYDAQKKIVDQHEHERDGAIINFDQDDPVFARRCLRLLLQHNPGALPDWLLKAADQGLQSLERGEASPIFEVSKDSHKLALEKRHWRLDFLAFAAYRKTALGISKTSTMQVICEAIGLESSEEWKEDLVKTFGSAVVENRLAEAENTGSVYNRAAIKKAKRQTNFIEEELAELQQLADGRYGDAALLELVNQYRAADGRAPLKKLGV